MIKFDLSAQALLKSYRKPTLGVIGLIKNALDKIILDFDIIGMGSKMLIFVKGDHRNQVIEISENDNSLKINFPKGQLISDRKTLLKRAENQSAYLLLVNKDDYLDLDAKYIYDLLESNLKEMGKY